MIQVKCDVYSFNSGNGCVDKKILIESAPSFPYKRKCINIILITLAAICGHGGALYINTSGCFLLWWSACSRLWVYRRKKKEIHSDIERKRITKFHKSAGNLTAFILSFVYKEFRWISARFPSFVHVFQCVEQYLLTDIVDSSELVRPIVSC